MKPGAVGLDLKDVSEAALKTRYCAQMMAAGCVLASTAPDDFRRRVLARPVLVYCHEFIRWARRAKNELRSATGDRETVGRIARALNDLEQRDWGDYEEIRHRIAAHRQTIAPDSVDALTARASMWSDLSDDALRILAEDARDIWNDIAAVSGVPRLESFPPIDPALQTAIDSHGYEPVPSGVVVGSGSFDSTRPDAVLATQGGDLGEQNRQLVDAVRNVRTLSQLWAAVNGYEPFWRVVLGATVTETCTLLDLLFEAPVTGLGHQQPALLALLERDLPCSLAIKVLSDARDSLEVSALAHVRDLRNRAGAHVDDKAALREISSLLAGFEPDKLNTVLDACFAAITSAANVELALRPILLHDAVMPGLSQVDRPETPPYGSA
ncbi:hypothetical protein [Paraconexibacter algicola]|uniref:Uncharacterized protein n=1 Tax=Paraconexibacter algicola TaxID=2133960 RepID=A0A2T4UDL3_9ACTN|nr:hypothetical protein [Paraconexibacter algicola]PTL55565.1 hypothetical protein C7Y72_18135 [Paraconexibacter algicola]